MPEVIGRRSGNAISYLMLLICVQTFIFLTSSLGVGGDMGGGGVNHQSFTIQNL